MKLDVGAMREMYGGGNTDEAVAVRTLCNVLDAERKRSTLELAELGKDRSALMMKNKRLQNEVDRLSTSQEDKAEPHTRSPTLQARLDDFERRLKKLESRGGW